MGHTGEQFGSAGSGRPVRVAGPFVILNARVPHANGINLIASCSNFFHIQ